MDNSNEDRTRREEHMNFLIAATIITHITLLFTSFTFKSFPRPIHPHTYTSNHLDSHFHDLSKLLLCSSREPVYLSQHRDICLSVRPSVSRVMCLSEAGKFNRNKRWSLAGRVFEPGTDKCDSLVVPPEVKKKEGQKQIWSSVSYPIPPTRLQLYAMSL